MALPSGNPRMEEPLRALLECAMAEHMGEAGADEAEAHVVRHMKALGLAALTGWACQAEQECTRSLMRDEPGARRRTKKK